MTDQEKDKLKSYDYVFILNKYTKQDDVEKLRDLSKLGKVAIVYDLENWLSDGPKEV